MTQPSPALAKNNLSTTTAKLWEMLLSSPRQHVETCLTSMKDVNFREYLYRIMEEHGKSIPDLISGACISKPYTYQFINGERLPGRDIVLRMGLYMRLSLDEVQHLLTLAGKSVLYPRLRRDAAIIYCIQKKINLDDTNSFLEDLGESPLLSNVL